jgi:hypothetical protein
MDKYPWLYNIAMENGPFIDGLPIKHCDFHGYVKKQMVIIVVPLLMVKL